MARQRDYHAEYLRRQELAAERFPDLSQAERTAHARGHRSTADLEQVLTRRDITNVDVLPSQGPDGRYQYVDVKVELRGGGTRTYRLQGRKATSKELQRLGRRLDRKGVRVAGIEYISRRNRRAA